MKNVKKIASIPYAPYCDICKTHNHNAGYGIAFDNGAHICMECALNICDMLRNCFGEETAYINGAKNTNEDTTYGGDD